VANEDQHDLEPGAPDSAEELRPGISAQGAARRRFAKAGLGASGVIMTLASQPGMATNVCRPPSGFLSGTWASNHPTNTCFGRSPGYWKNHHDQWKTSCRTDGTTLFRSLFSCTGPGSRLQAYKLFDIVDPTKVANGADRNNVAMHIVAALLNARANKVSVLPEERVREIWSEYVRTSYYTPSAGAKKWNGAEIVTYLKSTMIY
jgi:hypothetical protein